MSKFNPEDSSFYKFSAYPQTSKPKLTKTQRKAMKAHKAYRENPRMLQGAMKQTDVISMLQTNPVVQYVLDGYKRVYNKMTERYHVRDLENSDGREPYWSSLVSAVNRSGIHYPFKAFLNDKNSAGFQRLA